MYVCSLLLLQSNFILLSLPLSMFRCPECGRLPPGRKKNESFRQLIGRKLSVRKSLSFKSTSSKQSGRSRDSRDRVAGGAGGGGDQGGGRHGDPSSSRGWSNQVSMKICFFALFCLFCGIYANFIFIWF